MQGGTVQQHVTSGQAAAAGSDGRRRWARRCNALVLDALRAVHDGGSAHPLSAVTSHPRRALTPGGIEAELSAPARLRGLCPASLRSALYRANAALPPPRPPFLHSFFHADLKPDNFIVCPTAPPPGRFRRGPSVIIPSPFLFIWVIPGVGENKWQ